MGFRRALEINSGAVIFFIHNQVGFFYIRPSGIYRFSSKLLFNFWPEGTHVSAEYLHTRLMLFYFIVTLIFTQPFEFIRIRIGRGCLWYSYVFL